MVTQGSYVITKEDAREHTIKELVNAFSDQVNLNPEEVANEDSELRMLTVPPHKLYTDLKQLYATLKGMLVKHVIEYIHDLAYSIFTEKYNQYVTILGGMIGEGACNVAHAENILEKINDDFKISYFLSG